MIQLRFARLSYFVGKGIDTCDIFQTLIPLI
jgi:hypothetical protein